MFLGQEDPLSPAFSTMATASDSATVHSNRSVSSSTQATKTTTYHDASDIGPAEKGPAASPLTNFHDSNVNGAASAATGTKVPAMTTYPRDTSKPYTKNFFDKGDAAIKEARVTYFKIYISGVLLVVVTIFAVFSIYWGSLWKIPAHALSGWIVDFDGDSVGRTIVQDLTSGSGRIIKWEVIPSSRFPHGPQDVILAMKDNQAWVAVTINEGTTARLQNSISSPDPAYNGSQAITAYGVEARNENAYRVFIRPLVQTSLDAIQFNFATQFASQLASSSEISRILSISPQTVVAPVSYTIVNLIPFSQPVASAVVFVGLIYLLILSFFVVMIAFNARQVSGINKLLNFRSLVIVRLVSSALGYFFLSFFYSLLNVAFKLDLSRKYGHAGFVIFWMLNWVGMLAVGLALESLITLLTPGFIPFFMILWIIVNVSVCIFPIQVLPRIYHYGYAMPFYNISNSTRSIAFGTKNTLGLNFGVLLCWVFILCLTLPAIQWIVRRKEMKADTSSPSGPVVREKQEA